LLNRSDSSTLRTESTAARAQDRAEAAARHGELLSRLAVIEGDMRQFYHLTGKLEARVDAVEKRVS